MREPLSGVLQSARVRAAASYPFRLGEPATNWRTTPFGGLAIVNNLSSVGDALVTVALAGSVFVSVSLHAARGRTALGLFFTVLPFAVVGPFLGPLIDRVRGGRKFIVLLAAIGRVAACLLMASWIHSLLLFPAAFLSLVCSKTHTVVKASLVPTVVEGDQDLVRANSKLAIGASVFTSLAALFGAAVYKIFGSRFLLDLDVLVFAGVAALSLYLLRGSPDKVERPAPAPALVRTRPEIPRELVLAQVAMAGMRMVSGFLTALVVFAFRRNGVPVIWYGLVAVGSVGGTFAGSLLAPVLRNRVSEKRIVTAAACAIGVTAVATTQMTDAHRRFAALLLAAVIGLGAAVAKSAFDAIVQRDTQDADRSRLFARFESVFQLVWVVGALVPTLIATSLFAGFVIVAVVVIATSGVFVFGVARERLRPLTHFGAPARSTQAPPGGVPPGPTSDGGRASDGGRGTGDAEPPEGWGAPPAPAGSHLNFPAGPPPPPPE